MAKLNVNPHQIAVAQSILVAFLWSTSWVLIKIGLADIPALAFAGLRNTLGFIFLLLWYLRSGESSQLRRLSGRNWLKLAFLGVLFYTLFQGGVFLSLQSLPAATVNLVISMASVFVAFIGMAVLREVPARLQWLGIAVTVGGSLLYFLPLQVLAGQVSGYIMALVALAAVIISNILSREINARGDIPPLLVTVVSLGFGGITMLIVGLASQGVPVIGLQGWLIILWLALVNTAFTYTIYNRTLRILSAYESNVIGNTTIIMIPLLAWIFLGEHISMRGIIGLLLFAVGVVLVQAGHRDMPSAGEHEAEGSPPGTGPR